MFHGAETKRPTAAMRFMFPVNYVYVSVNQMLDVSSRSTLKLCVCSSNNNNILVIIWKTYILFLHMKCSFKRDRSYYFYFLSFHLLNLFLFPFGLFLFLSFFLTFFL